jgi:magnesium-transporting ATPase (P-type)
MTASVLRGQPTEGALLSLAGKISPEDLRSRHTRLKELPFSSDSKTMAVLCQVGYPSISIADP